MPWGRQGSFLGGAAFDWHASDQRTDGAIMESIEPKAWTPQWRPQRVK